MNITAEEVTASIESFLAGEDPHQHIVNAEFDYRAGEINLVIQTPTGLKLYKDKLHAFVWVKNLKNLGIYGGDANKVARAMNKYHISVRALDTQGHPRLEEGYKYLVQSKSSLNDLQNFFRDGGLSLRSDDAKNWAIVLSPVEQYLVSKGKRLFKGYEDYEDIHRVVFDIETTSLAPAAGRVFMIGIKDNRGFEKLLAVNRNDDDNEERRIIVELFQILNDIKPSVIGGYNSESFDWFYILERCRLLKLDPTRLCSTLHPAQTIKRKPSTLKIGGETEFYEKTVIWGYNVIDIAHAVRRAQAINSDIKSYKLKYIAKFSEIAKENRVYIENGNKIGPIWQANQDYWFKESTGTYVLYDPNDPKLQNLDTRFPGIYTKVNGQYIVTRYLMDDLWETLEVDNQYNQQAFMMAKMAPTSYMRAATMGNASIWKLQLLAWSFKHGLAVPKKDPIRDFTGGLSRLFAVGYAEKIIKFDFNGLYPNTMLTHDVFPTCDVDRVLEKMLRYFTATRSECKALMQKYEAEGNDRLRARYDRKQLPIKILNNSLYGAMTAPMVFPWAEIDKGEEVTCRGRNYLRTMVRFFMARGFEPLVLDTDGVNFTYENVDLNYVYIGKGLGGGCKEGKEYTGIDAYLMEFNDTYMRGTMKLEADAPLETTINVKRKNYASAYYKKGKLDIKLTGATIKKKTLPTYVAEFMDRTFDILLDPSKDRATKGLEWVEYYYEYLAKIYNREIPLLKVASKSRVRMLPEEYRLRAHKKNKNGKALPKLAYLELVTAAGRRINIGDTVYYVNNGTKKSHGDVGTHKKEKKGPDIINSYLLPENIEDTPDLTGEYNVARAISSFNSALKGLMCVFKPDIRDEILVDNPVKRGLFTKQQCELDRGNPLKPGHQDGIEEDLFTYERKEQLFWHRFYTQKNGDFPRMVGEIDDPSLPNSYDEPPPLPGKSEEFKQLEKDAEAELEDLKYAIAQGLIIKADDDLPTPDEEENLKIPIYKSELEQVIETEVEAEGESSAP